VARLPALPAKAKQETVAQNIRNAASEYADDIKHGLVPCTTAVDDPGPSEDHQRSQRAAVLDCVALMFDKVCRLSNHVQPTPESSESP
jgi:hypothetical protein